MSSPAAPIVLGGAAGVEQAAQAPGPDRQQPHADDEVYVVLEGSGVLEIEGRAVPLVEGEALFVPAGADHRFTAYEHLALDAAMRGGRQRVFEALLAHPLVGQVDRADGLTDRLIAHNREHLPWA